MNGGGRLFDKVWSRKLIVFGVIAAWTVLNAKCGHVVPHDEWREILEFAGKYLIAQGFADGVAPVAKAILDRRNGRDKSHGDAGGNVPSGPGK